MPNFTIIESKIVNENKIFENLFCGMEGKKALHRDRKTSIIEKNKWKLFPKYATMIVPPVDRGGRGLWTDAL